MKKIKIHKGKKYSICSSGLSNILPLCDNAHRKYNEENKTNYKSVKIISEETTEININSSRWEEQ